jgi:hypothetical protein
VSTKQQHRLSHFPEIYYYRGDIGGKFAVGINHEEKFAAGIRNARGKLPPESSTPVNIFAMFRKFQSGYLGPREDVSRKNIVTLSF